MADTTQAIGNLAGIPFAHITGTEAQILDAVITADRLNRGGAA